MERGDAKRREDTRTTPMAWKPSCVTARICAHVQMSDLHHPCGGGIARNACAALCCRPQHPRAPSSEFVICQAAVHDQTCATNYGHPGVTKCRNGAWACNCVLNQSVCSLLMPPDHMELVALHCVISLDAATRDTKFRMLASRYMFWDSAAFLGSCCRPVISPVVAH
jgi:hypothetical protein